MDYLKDYSEKLYTYMQDLHQRESQIARDRKINWLQKEFYHLRRKYMLYRYRPQDEIMEKASAFLNRPVSEIESIAQACLEHRENQSRLSSEKETLPFWTTDLDHHWLCLNLYVQTNWYRGLLKRLLEVPEMYKVKTIYDYACGCGAFALMLNNLFKFRNVVLSDLDHYASEFVRYYIQQSPHKNIQWESILQSDNTDVENAYDMILCLDVLEHLENSYHHFLKLHRKLKSGGILVLKIAFESNDPTHLPQACEDFFIKNNGWDFLNMHYIVHKRFKDEHIINGIYIKK